MMDRAEIPGAIVFNAEPLIAYFLQRIEE